MSSQVPSSSFPEHIIQEHGSIEQGIAWFKEHLAEQPVDYRLNLQVLANLIGQEEQAYEYSRQLLQIAPQDPRVLFNHGWHLLKREKFKEGYAHLEHGRLLKTFGAPEPASPMPLLTRDSVVQESSHLLLVLEGGLGDEMINVRFVRNISQLFHKKTIIACQPSLIPLLAKMPEAAAVIGHDAIPATYHDFWLPGMSAPLYLCDSFQDVHGKEPYLFAKPLPQYTAWKEHIEKLRKPDRKLKVGLRWSGNSQFEHQQFRRFPKDLILDLQKTPGIQFYSFQRDEDLLEELPENMVDLAPLLRDWADTACALEEMDLVITSCTSIAHCSAALGKKTWVVTPVLPYYIWATPGSNSPWYKDVTLFRQTQFGEWGDVKAALAQNLGS